MATFFGIVFTLYGLINFYIIKRALTVVPSEHKSLFLVVTIFIVLSYIIGRFLEKAWLSPVSDFFIYLGSFWLAFMFYFFLCLLVIDIIRLLNAIIPFLPSVITQNVEKAKRITAIVVLVLVTITVVGGYINTKMIVTKTYKININKKAGNLKSLNIVMASDIHLGTMLGHVFMYKVMDQINSLKPDIILFAGDIVDEDIGPVIRDNVGEKFEMLKSKYGVYAITGNHEYIGGVKAAVDYLSKHGVKFLRDSSAFIDNGFYLVGREDRAKRQFNDGKRKELKEIMADVNKSFPIILMDHQPFQLNEAFENEVDLQLSGHTHNGQLWPVNYIVDKIYDLAWGYGVNGKTHYYVSCGVGGWGPLVRTGSRPEIINIKLNFTGKDK